MLPLFESGSTLSSAAHQACVDVTKVIIRLLDDTLDYPSGKQRADGPQHATGNRPALNSDDRVHEL